MLEQEEWGFYSNNSFTGNSTSAQDTNPKMEAYVQQLIAQGYPEAQARAYAMQFADRFK